MASLNVGPSEAQKLPETGPSGTQKLSKEDARDLGYAMVTLASGGTLTQDAMKLIQRFVPEILANAKALVEAQQQNLALQKKLAEHEIEIEESAAAKEVEQIVRKAPQSPLPRTPAPTPIEAPTAKAPKQAKKHVRAASVQAEALPPTETAVRPASALAEVVSEAPPEETSIPAAPELKIPAAPAEATSVPEAPPVDTGIPVAPTDIPVAPEMNSGVLKDSLVHSGEQVAPVKTPSLDQSTAQKALQVRADYSVRLHDDLITKLRSDNTLKEQSLKAMPPDERFNFYQGLFFDVALASRPEGVDKNEWSEDVRACFLQGTDLPKKYGWKATKANFNYVLNDFANSTNFIGLIFHPKPAKGSKAGPVKKFVPPAAGVLPAQGGHPAALLEQIKQKTPMAPVVKSAVHDAISLKVANMINNFGQPNDRLNKKGVVRFNNEQLKSYIESLLANKKIINELFFILIQLENFKPDAGLMKAFANEITSRSDEQMVEVFNKFTLNNQLWLLERMSLDNKIAHEKEQLCEKAFLKNLEQANTVQSRVLAEALTNYITKYSPEWSNNAFRLYQSLSSTFPKVKKPVEEEVPTRNVFALKPPKVSNRVKVPEPDYIGQMFASKGAQLKHVLPRVKEPLAGSPPQNQIPPKPPSGVKKTGIQDQQHDTFPKKPEKPEEPTKSKEPEEPKKESK
jgi:hypothetical protein